MQVIFNEFSFIQLLILLTSYHQFLHILWFKWKFSAHRISKKFLYRWFVVEMEWLDLLSNIQVDKSCIRTNGRRTLIIQMGNQQAKLIAYDKIREEFKSCILFRWILFCMHWQPVFEVCWKACEFVHYCREVWWLGKVHKRNWRLKFEHAKFYAGRPDSRIKFKCHVSYFVKLLNRQSFTKFFFHTFRSQYQANSRAREARDYALIKDNNSYVGTWSIVQIFVIVVTTTVQVYFVRKLFDIKSSGYSRSRI